MADILCGYTADRDETLVAYLYGDIDEAQRLAFEAHIATCDRCRHELAELRGVRSQLREWTMPEPRSPLALTVPPALAVAPPARPASRTWRDIPAWAQVAAAMLVFGVSLGLANVDVRYDAAGLTIRTGWSRSSTIRTPTAVAQPAATSSPPWQSDMAALERRIRADIHST